jgi:imidazolonepropionase-like amidohydrolase
MQTMMGLPLTLLASMIATTIATQLTTQPGAAQTVPARSFAVEHVRVFDGLETHADETVVVQDGKIVAVGSQVAVPAGIQRVTGQGRTLLPGLIDAHAHIWNEDQLRQAEAFGTTTVLDMFADWHSVRQTKADIAAGKLEDGADLYSAGTLATAPGGHGTEYGFKIPTISSPAEAQAWVDARIAEGSDYIKIVLDDGSTYGLHFPTISPETLRALVVAAHARGKLAVVHVGSLADAEAAINAGADGLMHLFVDREPDANFGRLVAEHHAFVVPTLEVLSSVSGEAAGKSFLQKTAMEAYLTPSAKANLVRAMPFKAQTDLHAATASIAQVLAVHVPILAGTDAPNPGTWYGVSLLGEMELLNTAGLTPSEALTAATAAPARAFHLADRGRIAPGLRADLLLVRGDPTTHLSDIENLVAVWKDGVEDDRSAVVAQVKKEDAEAQASATVAQSPAFAGGLVSGFDDGSMKSTFGAGWLPSTDQMIGGKSDVSLKVVDSGAASTAKALEVTGTISGATSYPWAGAMFSPGERPFTPANLSHTPVLVFWAKGDGKPHRVLCFTTSGGRIPAMVPFTPGSDWAEVRIPMSAFHGSDGHDVQALIFDGGRTDGGTTPGPFRFEIDEVRLVGQGSGGQGSGSNE